MIRTLCLFSLECQASVKRHEDARGPGWFRERARTDGDDANGWGCRLPTYEDIVLSEQMLKKRVTARGLMDLRGASHEAEHHHPAGSDSVARELARRRSDAASDDDEPSVPYRAQWDPLLGASPANRARVQAALAAQARATAAVASAAAAVVVNCGEMTTAGRQAAHAAVRQMGLLLRHCFQVATSVNG